MSRFDSVILVAMILLSSCTVMENRHECPCDVTVMTDGFIHEGHSGDLTLSVFTNQMSLKTLYRYPLKLEDFMSGLCTVQVPKGWFDVSVTGGVSPRMKLDRDTLLLIPAGCQCDSVCAFSMDCYAHENDDIMTVKCPLNKQYCKMTITVKDEKGNMLDAELEAKGLYDGINILSLEPHRGEFSFNMTETDSGVYEARIPRQGDSSLMLDIRIPGIIEDTVALGEIVQSSGYSWGTLSLEDLNIDFVYEKMGFTVTVSDWGAREIGI